MSMQTKPKNISGSWAFLFFVLLLYAGLLLLSPEVFRSAGLRFVRTAYKIAPIFLLVFVLMTISNYCITRGFIVKHFQAKGPLKWFFAVIGGILSSGPIFVWYPLLKEWRDKGLNDGLVACFLYNRGVKIPMLAMAIFYFGWKYIIVLSLVMVFFSLVQGLLINKLMEK